VFTFVSISYSYVPISKSATANRRLIKLQRVYFLICVDGTWVQCSVASCGKWRHLADVDDPCEVRENWVCSLNGGIEASITAQISQSVNEI
jgi:hypothetical protein